jgi:hypothetical protein
MYRLTAAGVTKLAEAIVRPADGSPAGATTVEGKYRIAWLHDGGRRPELVAGVILDHPRDAARLTHALNRR